MKTRYKEFTKESKHFLRYVLTSLAIVFDRNYSSFFWLLRQRRIYDTAKHL